MSQQWKAGACGREGSGAFLIEAAATADSRALLLAISQNQNPRNSQLRY